MAFVTCVYCGNEILWEEWKKTESCMYCLGKGCRNCYDCIHFQKKHFGIIPNMKCERAFSELGFDIPISDFRDPPCRMKKHEKNHD